MVTFYGEEVVYDDHIQTISELSAWLRNRDMSLHTLEFDQFDYEKDFSIWGKWWNCLAEEQKSHIIASMPEGCTIPGNTKSPTSRTSISRKCLLNQMDKKPAWTDYELGAYIDFVEEEPFFPADWF